MAKVMLGNSMWQLVVMSDFVSKFILLLLLGMSITCWTIFFYKLILLRLKKEQMRQALAAIKNVHNLNDLLALSAEFARTIPGYFISHNLAYLKNIAQRRSPEQPLLTQREWEGVQNHVHQTFDEVMQQEESYMPILYASAGVATLIGLFGTVWGLVHAFIRISEKQAADITTVAPGIAEALITTLGGLIVAIPAYVMFHYLMVQIKKLEGQFAALSDTFSWIIKQLFVQ